MRRLLASVAIACSLALSPSVAQEVGVVQSEILVLDRDKLFAETQLGQSLSDAYLSRREALIARNRELEAELEAEELELTRLREETAPEEFRDLANAFDAKVQTIRQESDRAVRELEQNRERAPIIFMRTVEPILVEIMRDAGGVVVMDVRSVLLSADIVDITDLAISRIDQRIGVGHEILEDVQVP